MPKTVSFLSLLAFVFSVIACQSPEARAPITRTSGSYIKDTAQRNQALTQREKDQGVKMHRQFQKDLSKMRLKTAETYLEMLSIGYAPMSYA